MKRMFCLLLAVLICTSLVASVFATDGFVGSVENTDPTTEPSTEPTTEPATDPTIDGGNGGDGDPEDNDHPVTGDTGNVIMWGGLMLLCAMALVVLLANRRRVEQ